MAENDWTTTSVKLERDLKLKLNRFCEVEGITPNKLIKQLIEKKLEFMIKPTSIRKDKGIPLLAKHEFEYDIQTDKFDWILDFNENNKQTLSKDISIDFLEKLKTEIENVIEEREKTKKKLGNKSVIPSDVLDYEVEE